MANSTRGFGLTLTALEPFRIGAVQNVMSSIKGPVAQVGGRVVVQGPTLKGALRAEIERHLIEKYATSALMKPCIPSSKEKLTGMEKELIKAGVYRDGSCSYEQKKDDRKKQQDKPPKQHPPICPACYLLGAQSLPGFIRVPYLYTDGSPESLYSVRMDRGSNAVADGTNRDYHILADGTVFTGVLEVLIEDIARRWKLGEKRCDQDEWLDSGEWTRDKIIQELVLDRLASIEIIGGFKSKGCGKVKIEVEEIKDK